MVENLKQKVALDKGRRAQAELDRISQLAGSGRIAAASNLASQLAEKYPDSVLVQLTAAFAYDRRGRDSEAISYYEKAQKLGIPLKQRFAFLISYGSTLRNVGRFKEAVIFLEKAAAEYSSKPAAHAFLALALNDLGEHEKAIAIMLRAGLAAARSTGFGGYRPALVEYQRALERVRRQKKPSDGSVRDRPSKVASRKL